jgi:tetratricopeptide (TPR) repeat protein
VRARRGYTATPRPIAVTTASARSAATSPVATDHSAPAPITEILTPERPAVDAPPVAVPATLPVPAAEAWVHYALGQADYALRQYPDAVSEWEKVHRAARDFEPVYFDLVDGYLQLKQHDKAIRLLREGAMYWPKDPDVFNALGVVQTVRGALDEAIAAFEQATVAAPGEAIGYFNLAKARELRFFRTRRYVQQTRRWLSHEQDRAAAIEHYERYITIGGPYAVQAREGLTRLNWVP